MKLNIKYGLLILASIAIGVGCSKKSSSSGDGGGSVGSVANIYGNVSTSSETSSGAQKMRSKMRSGGGFSLMSLKPFEKDVFALEACSIKAYDLTSGAEIPGVTATTDVNGDFTLTGVTSGVTYRLIATCGTHELAVVATADSITAEAKKNQGLVTTVNPVSSLIAAMIVQAVLDAVTTTLTSLGSLPQSVIDGIKETINKEVIPKIVVAVTTLVESYIDDGTWAPPTIEATDALVRAAAASGDSNAIKAALQTFDNATGSESSDAATKATASATSQTGMSAFCSGAAASVTKCSAALAKLMYNSLHFRVGVRVDTGGSFESKTCDETSLGSDFKDAIFFAAGAALPVGDNGGGGGGGVGVGGGDTVPTGYCVIIPRTQEVDRNQDPSNGGGGDKGEMVFLESGSWSNNAVVGLLTEMATSMVNNYRYTLADLERWILDFDTTSKAGLNMRLFIKKNNASDYKPEFYYINSDGAWVKAENPQQGQTENMFNYFDISDIVKNASYGADGVWTVTGDATTLSLIQAIDAGKARGLNTHPFEKKFGDNPNLKNVTATKLDSLLDGRIHVRGNATGEKEFRVLFSGMSRWSEEVCIDTTGATCAKGSSNCTCTTVQPCDDDDFTTACNAYDSSGTKIDNPAVRVKFGYRAALGTGADADFVGVKPLGSMELVAAADCATVSREIATGKADCYFLQPMWNGGGFDGSFVMVRAIDGQRMMDKFRRMRTIKMVLKASECTTYSIPADDICAIGSIYNADLSYPQQCNGNCFPTVTIIDKAQLTVPAATVAVISPFKEHVVKWNDYWPQGKWAAPPISSGTNWDDRSWEPIRFTIASASSVAVNASTGTYVFAPYQKCDQNGCVNKTDSNGNALFQALVYAGNFSGGSLTSTEPNAGKPYAASACMFDQQNGDPSPTCTTDGPCEYTTAQIQAKANSCWGGGQDVSTIGGNWQCTGVCDGQEGSCSCGYALFKLFTKSVVETALDGSAYASTYYRYNSPNGPTTNLTWECAREAFYFDVDGDGKLTCNATDPHAQPASDVTVRDSHEMMWRCQDWIRNAAKLYNRCHSQTGGGCANYSTEYAAHNAFKFCSWADYSSQLSMDTGNFPGGQFPDSSKAGFSSQYKLKPNDNGYAFGNFQGAKDLLVNAFGSKLDGGFSIDINYKFDALQGFAMIYLYMDEGGGDGGRKLTGIDATAPTEVRETTMEGARATLDEGLWFNLGLGKAAKCFRRDVAAGCE
jgi:hypothetical protein